MRQTSFFADSTSTPLSAKTFKGFLQHEHLHSVPHFPFILRQLHLCVLQPEEHIQVASPLLEEELGDFLGLLVAKRNRDMLY